MSAPQEQTPPRKPGCRLCADGQPGFLSVVMASHRDGRPMTTNQPWAEGLRTARAGQMMLGWRADEAAIRCACVGEPGAAYRWLDAWSAPDRQEVLVAIIDGQRDSSSLRTAHARALAIAGQMREREGRGGGW